MKAKELMIGDWVKQKHGGLLLKVCAIEPPYVRAEGEGGQFHEDMIEPINPTPELMRLNGFKGGSGPLENSFTLWIGEKRISVFLHDCLGKFYAYDYWIERPWEPGVMQTMYADTWLKTGNPKHMILDVYEKYMSAGDTQGIQNLQHAMVQAEIEFEWKFKED